MYIKALYDLIKSWFSLTELKVYPYYCNSTYNAQETNSVAKYLLSITNVFTERPSGIENNELGDHRDDITLSQQLQSLL